MGEAKPVHCHQMQPQSTLVTKRSGRTQVVLIAWVVALICSLGNAQGVPGQQLHATDPAQPEASKAWPALTDDVISPDDLLDVSVFDVPEMSRTYRVHANGSIELPLIHEPVSAAGLTPDQLCASIIGRLQADGLVSHPQVTVEIKESRLHSVIVAGEVKKPQIYPVLGATRLLDVIAQAEGLTDNAGSLAVVTRGTAGLGATSPDASGSDTAGTVTIDLKHLIETNDPKLNIQVYPG